MDQDALLTGSQDSSIKFWDMNERVGKRILVCKRILVGQHPVSDKRLWKPWRLCVDYEDFMDYLETVPRSREGDLAIMDLETAPRSREGDPAVPSGPSELVGVEPRGLGDGSLDVEIEVEMEEPDLDEDDPWAGFSLDQADW